MNRKVGILGGTFDPPHYGHLFIAQEVFDACGLDEIWFMPTKIPPHKDRKQFFTDEERIQLLQLAINDNSAFHLNLTEFEREGRSYTIDTMKELSEKNPDDHYYFIIGGDMIDYLPKWKGIYDLLKLVTFVGVKRPGYPSTTNVTDEIVEIDVPQLEISSSDIRNRIRSGRSIRYLLPDDLITFIKGRQYE